MSFSFERSACMHAGRWLLCTTILLVKFILIVGKHLTTSSSVLSLSGSYLIRSFIVIDGRGSCEIAPPLGGCRAKIALGTPRRTSEAD
jgi:hypothetical protein